MNHGNHKHGSVIYCPGCGIKIPKHKLRNHLKNAHGYKCGFSVSDAINELEHYKAAGTIKRNPKFRNTCNTDNIKPDSKWMKKQCLRCKKTIYIHSDWVRPVYFCKKCKKYRQDARIKASNTDSSTIKKSHFKGAIIFQGGAPGLGKKS